MQRLQRSRKCAALQRITNPEVILELELDRVPVVVLSELEFLVPKPLEQVLPQQFRQEAREGRLGSPLCWWRAARVRVGARQQRTARVIFVSGLKQQPRGRTEGGEGTRSPPSTRWGSPCWAWHKRAARWQRWWRCRRTHAVALTAEQRTLVQPVQPSHCNCCILEQMREL